MDTEIELEPAVRRLVALANGVGRADRETAAAHERAAAAGLRRVLHP